MVGAGIFSLLEYVVRGLGNGHVTGIIAWLILAANAIVTGMVAVSFGSYASAALADSTSTCLRSPATPRSATSCPASP
jgi:amino acid transporter